MLVTLHGLCCVLLMPIAPLCAFLVRNSVLMDGLLKYKFDVMLLIITSKKNDRPL
jgi:hypothetical protein